MHVPIVILGAGIAGISAANAIQHTYPQDYLVLESSGAVGGMSASFTIDGFNFDYGIHGLYTDDYSVFETLANAISNEHDSLKLSIVDYWKGEWSRHPIHSNLASLPSELASEYLEDFLQNLGKVKVSDSATFQEWCLSKLGHRISTSFVFPYVRKFWTVEPSELTSDWMGPRIKVPTVDEIVAGAMVEDAPDHHYVKNIFYPRHSGFGAYAEALSKGVRIGFHKEPTQIDTNLQRINLSDGTCVTYDCIISSVPLPSLLQLILDVPRHVSDSARKLRATSLALVSLGIKRSEVLKHHWVYVHDSDLTISRLSSPSNWASENAPSEMSSIQAEVYFRGRVQNKNRLMSAVLDDLRRMNILRESDEVLVDDFRVKEYANVIYDRHRASALKGINAFLNERRVFVCGRYGLWDYSLVPEVMTRARHTVEAALLFLNDGAG
jgi:protoporphyrinogen oxidase